MNETVEHFRVWLKYAEIWYFAHILVRSFDIQNELECVVVKRHLRREPNEVETVFNEILRNLTVVFVAAQ